MGFFAEVKRKTDVFLCAISVYSTEISTFKTCFKGRKTY
jgi:hypothetical protein